MSGIDQAKQYFPDRGIREETFRAHQIEIIFNPTHEQLISWLGLNSYYLEAAIVFPNLVCNPDDLSTSVHNYYVRCFPPPIGQDGKPRKFLSTFGSTYRPYVLPEVLDVAYDIGRPLYIVEKQTAALLLWQNELPAIALDGTWGAGAKRVEGEKVKLHPVLEEFDLIGRPVYLCFDTDFRSRESVLQGLVRTYVLFSIAGAIVRVIQWDSQFKGLEDFIAATAALDLIQQRTELDALTATVSDLPAKKASGNWIIPQYRTLFDREIAAIIPGSSERSMLAECIYEALGTRLSDLKNTWKVLAKEPEPAKKSDGIMPVPEVWPEPLVHSEVLDDVLSEFLDPHLVVITDAQAILSAIHTLTTYLTDYIDDWLHFVYITAGAKESGKTKLLLLFFHLSYHADLSGNPSAASIYYTLQDGTYSILIDEVDKNAERREAVLDLINFSSSRQTAWVSRVDLEKGIRKKYCTFCPKILAGNGSIRDTASSRCIKIQMIRKGPSGPRVMIKKADRARFEILRSKLMRVASEIGPKIQDYDIDKLKLPGGIYNREADNWILPFLTAELVGGEWPKLIRAAFMELCPPRNPDAADDAEGTEYGEPLIRDIARIWVETRDQEFYATEVLKAKLNAFKDRPWPGLNKGFGITRQKISSLLLGFGKRAVKRRLGQGARHWGYELKDMVPLFESYASDIWNAPPPSDEEPPEPPSDDGGSPAEPERPKPLPVEENKEKSSNEGVSVGPSNQAPADQVLERIGGVVLQSEENSNAESDSSVGPGLTPSESSPKVGGGPLVLRQSPHSGIFSFSIPPSTPQASFCTPSDPGRLIFLDGETFYPWDSSYPQPPESTPGLRKQNKRKAHPWAKDPRRCVLRFLTIHDTEGTFGSEPFTIDFQADPNLADSVREALANCTLVGHNLDFDLTVLRRYEITVSSSVIDVMMASRLLGLGKEKSKGSDMAYCDLSDEELEELTSTEADPNPGNNDLAAIVRRYLGIKMDKIHTKLGGSDWSRTDLSPAHYAYMAEDVSHLPALWSVLEKELRETQLDQVFRERMKFFPHLNQIKMTGNPIDSALRDGDYKSVTAEKEAIREELRTMFVDYRHPIPKSRLKTVKVQVECGKFKRVPGPSEEEFSPSNRDHVLGALAHCGIPLENTQEITLSRIDQPETRLLLKYGEAKKRLDAVKAIVRSTFPDNRVRAAGWNQLAARTGRIISTEPNLQQVPKNWRSAFRVDPSMLWLKADLSQIEVVILAVVTGDRALIDLLKTGKDLYVMVAARLFGVEPRRGEKEGLVTEFLRDAAKIVVLGTNYGLTIYGLRRQMREKLDLELSLEEAQTFFDSFFEMFPGIATYHEKALEAAKSMETVRTAGGQRRFLPPLLDDATDNYWPSLDRRRKVLINTPIQGGQADLQIRAVNKFMPKLPPGVEVVNLVHDEVDAIVTAETLHPTIEVIRSAFRGAFRELYGEVLVPNIKFSKGPSWGELDEIAL